MMHYCYTHKCFILLHKHEYTSGERHAMLAVLSPKSSHVQYQMDHRFIHLLLNEMSHLPVEVELVRLASTLDL